MNRLNQLVALVTGGASGFGKAIAHRLSAEGARVVITDIQSESGLVTANELGCTFLPHDVADENHWDRVVLTVQKDYGGLHILVNNAGIIGSTPKASPQETKLDDWRKIFAINVEGVFLGCRAAIPVIHASGGGAIINICSIAALLATPYATAYGASKAAVRQLTKSVAQHCAQMGMNIRCNSVHPGDVRTKQWDQYVEAVARERNVSLEDVLAEVKAGIPLGEFTMPEDISAIVCFLASTESRHITGAELIVDGGVINCDTYRPTRIARQTQSSNASGR